MKQEKGAEENTESRAGLMRLIEGRQNTEGKQCKQTTKTQKKQNQTGP